MADYVLIYDTTPIIRVSDSKYPMYMPQVRLANPNTSFPNPIRDTSLLDWGYMPVYETQKPSGDVITEGTPEQREDGNWYKTWISRDFTEDELELNLSDAKNTLLFEVVNILNSDLGSGIAYTYNDVPYYVDVSPENMTLLLAMKSLAKDAEETATFEFSFTSDVVTEMTRDEFLVMLNVLFQAIYNIHKSYWAFRQEVNETTEIESLPEMPATFKE